MNKQRRIKKDMTAKGVLTILQFYQYVVQGVYKLEDPLMMVPHVDNQTILKLKKQMKKKPDLETFVKLTNEEWRQLECFSQGQLEDIESFCKYMPQIEFKAEVQGGTDIEQMDFVVIDLVLWRLNIKEDEEVSFIHSNTFPYLKKEIYRIILTDTEQERAIVSYS